MNVETQRQALEKIYQSIPDFYKFGLGMTKLWAKMFKFGFS